MTAIDTIRITGVEIADLRVPTSDTLLGSDPFHKKPNYSAVLTTLKTDAGTEGLSVCFTAGAGNDWIAYDVRDLSQLIKGLTLEEFTQDPGTFQRSLVDHHQLRWLADGVYQIAVGRIINALWDLWAKWEGKPLWKLLVDLPPEKVVQSIDWRYLHVGIGLSRRDPAGAAEGHGDGLAPIDQVGGSGAEDRA